MCVITGFVLRHYVLKNNLCSYSVLFHSAHTTRCTSLNGPRLKEGITRLNNWVRWSFYILSDRSGTLDTRLKQHSHTHTRCLSHPKNMTRTVVGLLVSLLNGQLYSVVCKSNLCEINMNYFWISGLGRTDFLRELCHSELSAAILYLWPLINTLFNFRFLQLVLGLPVKESG